MEGIRKKMRSGKAIAIGVLLALTLVFLASTCTASASTVYVPNNYSTIQAAVNAAYPGDTIIVRDGTYIENNITVDKSLTIRSENGPASTIVRAEKSSEKSRYPFIFPEARGFMAIADYVNISGFTVESANVEVPHFHHSAGIFLYSVDYCNISSNICGDSGIYLYSANNNSISNNTCSNNVDVIFALGWSINLRDSHNNSIANNTCSGNDDSNINLYSSNNNSILGNNCSSNNRAGISFRDSNNNNLKDNLLVENGIYIEGDSVSDYTHEIDTSNTVNGKPVYYWKNVEGGRVPDGAGQVILVNCTNVVVENQNLNNASVGIDVAYSSYIAIRNNNCSDNYNGISLRYSHNNSILNNTCSNNYDGISLRYSHNNSILNNTCSNNYDGIYLSYSNNNSIYSNNCSNKGNEKYIGYSYFYGEFARQVPIHVPIVNRTTQYAFRLKGRRGISLESSNNNSIYTNNCTNNGYGIVLMDSNNNFLYLNNFINSTANVFSYESTNTWNSKEQLTYVYNERTYTNYLGNYWADYVGTDADGDGIGYFPYSRLSSRLDRGLMPFLGWCRDKDNYPLVEPWEKYFHDG